MRREWIEIYEAARLSAYSQSPSMRREWIEMYRLQTAADPTLVSLHAEGVD